MEMLTVIPEVVLEYLKRQKKTEYTSMLIGMSAKENMPASGDVYLYADRECLCVLKGVIRVGGERNFARDALDASFVETDYRAVSFSDAEDFDIEELVSGVRLTFCAKGGEKILLVEASNTYKEAVMLFAAYLKQIMSGDFSGVEADDIEHRCPKCNRRYPDKRRVCPHCSDNRSIIKRLVPFFVKYRFSMLAMFSMLVIISALGVVSPYVSNSFYIDKVLSEDGEFYGRVMLAIVLLISVKAADAVISLINDIVTAKIGANVTYDLKKTIFSSINRLSLGFFNSRQTGALMTQVESDASTLYNFFSGMTPNLVVSVVKIIGITAVMLALEPVLAAVTVLVMPLYVFMMKYAYKKNLRIAMLHFLKMKALSAKLSDVLSGLRVVKVFAKEKAEGEKFAKMSKDKTDIYYEWTMYDTAIYTFIDFVLYLATVAVWAIGGMFVFRGRLSYGDLLTFVAYMGMVYSPLNFIIGCIRRLGDSMSAASRLFEIYDASPDVVEKENPVHIEDFKGEVEFRDVSFAYTKSKRTVENVSFKVAPGQTLGIVGRTGVGKSTLVNLLIRLYDANAGEILIDGVNVKDLSFEELRRNVAIVSQETYLFCGTIFENIAYSMKNASHADVINAAIEAGAHDFIMKLPDGYETRIGFGYKNLSGGERQRISIARALLKKPKILILDEATAAMDTLTEQRIEHAIDSLSGKCTTIMIAHRLSTLKSADSLIVIENGRVFERGTHAELLANENGIYHRLYTLQLEALRNIISDEYSVEMPPRPAPACAVNAERI